MKITLLSFDTIDSTNTEALKHARQGAEEGVCIVARHQTSGRGRHGRKWESAEDSGLYFSIILRPQVDPKFLPLITLMAGVAVHDTILELGVKPDIKWVNDILVNEKKIAGILAETTETQNGLAVVVGIGINLRSSNFPPEIAATAASVDEFTDQTPTAEELADSLAKHVNRFYERLRGDAGAGEIIDEWRKRSSYFSGKAVRVVLENETILGVTDGLEPNGALRVTTAGGLWILQAGDVQLLRTAKS